MAEETPHQQYQRLLAENQKPKQNKYRNKPITREGVRYDSQAEYRYKGRLDNMVLANEIKGYDYHVKLPLLAEGGKLVGYYEVDFLVYKNDGSQEFHDVKGKPNDIFPWKAKHVLAQYGNPVILIDPKTLAPKNNHAKL